MDFDTVIYITCIYDSVQVYSGMYHSYLCYLVSGSIHPVSMDLDNLHNLYLRQRPGVQWYVSQLFVLFGSIHPVSMDLGNLHNLYL